MKLRCRMCNKLLAKGVGKLEIKCPRCKSINNWSLTTENAAEHQTQGDAHASKTHYPVDGR